MLNLENTLKKLGLYSTRATKRLLLNPEIVELAVNRLEQPLSLDAQKIVLRSVSTPKKVKWPDWWTAC